MLFESMDNPVAPYFSATVIRAFKYIISISRAPFIHSHRLRCTGEEFPLAGVDKANKPFPDIL